MCADSQEKACVYEAEDLPSASTAVCSVHTWSQPHWAVTATLGPSHRLSEDSANSGHSSHPLMSASSEVKETFPHLPSSFVSECIHTQTGKKVHSQQTPKAATTDGNSYDTLTINIEYCPVYCFLCM